MLTSLNIATDGLLDRGNKPTLAIATSGLIRIGIEAVVEVVRRTARHVGGYVEEQGLNFKRIIQEDKEILETIIQSFIAGIFDD